MARPSRRRALGRALFGRRPPWWLLLGTVAAVVAVVALLVRGTGGTAGQVAVPLRAADVPAAVEALEHRLGGAQRYTEINAVADGVNLFVAGDGGTEAQWFYSAGTLAQLGPAGPAAADRAAFALDGVLLDKSTSVARSAMGQFPTATLTQFALVKLPDAGLVWSLSLQSSRGGRIDVSFSPLGTLLGAELR